MGNPLKIAARWGTFYRSFVLWGSIISLIYFIAGDTDGALHHRHQFLSD